MPTIFKRVLIACFFAVPSLACAAGNSAVAKPATPPQVAAEVAPKAAAAALTARIGYVDMAKIATESEQGKALKTLLTARKDKLQGKINVKKKQIEKLKASIEAKIAKMTPQQREAKSKEFQKKVGELQKLARESEEEFVSLQDKETGALFKAIEQAAVSYGKAGGFAAIVAKKELLYTGSSVEAQDVTDALIKELNQAGKKK
ncbi:MAG: OmpH family outer membrane protein [Desulfuromonadaceae bacterium]|nr:OmpH family outer membrane protein [Desulfuromonadaceae bacterium]